MHKYFRAIGFSVPFKAHDAYNLIEDVLDKAEDRFYITDPLDEDSMLSELRYDFGFGYGICAIGVFDEDNEFNCEALFPYFISESVSSIEQVSVEERIEGHTFAGVVDDLSVGTTLIFRLINSVEFLKYGAPQMKQIPIKDLFILAGKISFRARWDDPRFSTVTFYSNRFGISDSATAMRALNQSVNNYTDMVMRMQTIIQDESR